MNRSSFGGSLRQPQFYLQYNRRGMKLGIELDVGDETVDKKQLEERPRKEAILALFADRKMPAGRASRELGLTRFEFMELCHKRDIPLYDYTLQDFEQDVKTIDKLWPEIERNVRESGGGRSQIARR